MNAAPAPQVATVMNYVDIPQLAGQPFTGSWFQVDADRLPAFDHASYADENVHDLDSDAYPEGLVEGFHLIALLDHLVNEVLYVEDPVWFGWNYGFDHIRFVSPITVNDRIRVTGSVANVESKGARFLVTIDCQIQVDGREKPGATAVWKVLWASSAKEGES